MFRAGRSRSCDAAFEKGPNVKSRHPRAALNCLIWCWLVWLEQVVVNSYLSSASVMLASLSGWWELYEALFHSTKPSRASAVIILGALRRARPVKRTVISQGV